MKLELKAFLPKLTTVKKVINNKPVIEAMANYLLQTKNGLLYINASDSESTVSVSVTPKEFSEMNICVNANDFYNSISKLNSNEIELLVNPEKKLIRCVYDSGFFQLPYDDNPNVTAVLEIRDDSYQIEKEITDTYTLSDAIIKAQMAAADDPMKPTLSGVYFDFKQDGMVIVATDANKMSKYKTDITIDTDIKGVIIPRKGANILTLLISECDCETVNMKVNDSSVLFKGETFSYYIRLTEGEYPNYEILVPTDNVYCATVNRDALWNAIRRVVPMESEKDQLLVVNLDKGSLIVEAEDVFFKKKAKEKMECQYDGEPVRIGMKSSNIIALLQTIDSDDVEIHFKTTRHAVVILPNSELKDRFLTLSMPMII